MFVQSRLERRSRKAASGSSGSKGFGAAAVQQQAELAGRKRMVCCPAGGRGGRAARRHVLPKATSQPVVLAFCPAGLLGSLPGTLRPSMLADHLPACRPHFCPSAGSPLPNNPQLVLHEWSAVYIPGTLLGSVGGVFSSAGDGPSLTLLPDNTALLAQDGSSGDTAAAAAADPAAAEDAAALDDLRRVLRGQDLSQLYAYIGLTPPGGEGSSGEGSSGSSTDGGAEQQQQGEGPAGLRAYEPEAGELVVLLAARISGLAATGAELLVAVRQPDGSTRLELPDGWEAMLAGA